MTRISVPEYRYKAYKSCEKSQTAIMAELLDTRIELNNARGSDYGDTWITRLGFILIGAGIYGLASK